MKLYIFMLLFIFISCGTALFKEKNNSQSKRDVASDETLIDLEELSHFLKTKIPIIYASMTNQTVDEAEITNIKVEHLYGKYKPKNTEDRVRSWDLEIESRGGALTESLYVETSPGSVSKTYISRISDCSGEKIKGCLNKDLMEKAHKANMGKIDYNTELKDVVNVINRKIKSEIVKIGIPDFGSKEYKIVLKTDEEISALELLRYSTSLLNLKFKNCRGSIYIVEENASLEDYCPLAQP